MSIEVKEFQLEPHGWKAIVSDSQGVETGDVECSGMIKPIDEADRAELLEQLAESAYTVYTLIQQRPLPSAAAETLVRFATEVQVTCTCGDEACPHIEAAKLAAASWAMAEPLALLGALGIARPMLLDGVFGSWEAESAGASLPQATMLQRPAARAGGNVSAIMDYIAESVKDSALHKPGHRLAEVELRLKAPAKFVPPQDLTALLPQAPTKAALTHLREQLSKRASEWLPTAKTGSKKKQ